MKNENVYSRLLDVLRNETGQERGCIFGTLTGVDPLTVRVGGREISEELVYPAEKVFHVEQIGQKLALLPCKNGILVLFEVEGSEI